MYMNVKNGTKLVCPVCGKEFTANNDTRYIVNKNYTCSWKCFMDRVAENEKAKAENPNPKKKTKKDKCAVVLSKTDLLNV